MNIKRITKVVLTALMVVMVTVGVSFAGNPFADVPADSWAISAVDYLAARGFVVGYPDGQFKGDKPATRYEVATVVAKAYASLDASKATKEDVEVLKKLAVEFADELKALGVKTEDLDKRVTVLEKGIGTWNISGSLEFDAKSTSGEMSKTPDSGFSSTPGSDEWTKNKAYLNLSKRIDDNTVFFSQFRFGAFADKYSDSLFKDYGKGDSNSFAVWQMYVRTKLPITKSGLGFTVGRFGFDWEDNAGLVTDNASLFGTWRLDGFKLDKTFNKLDTSFVIGRNSTSDYQFYPYVKKSVGRFDVVNKDASYVYSLNLKYDFNDRLMFGVNGTANRFDNVKTIGTIGAYGRYALNPQNDLGLQGVFYWQKASDRFDVAEVTAQSHTAFKGTFYVKQNMLKFTDLWIEYADISNGFAGLNMGGNYQTVNAYSPFDMYSSVSALNNKPLNEKRTDVWVVKLNQQWKSPKWSSFIRLVSADYNTAGIDNAFEWGVGVNYKLTPGIKFMLAFDQIDYNNGVTDFKGQTAYGKNTLRGKDNCVIFRTTVEF